MAEFSKSLGLCLSGGAARAVAHMGVLHALDEAGIRPKVMSGCSAGAIVGALYCSGVTPKEMLRITQKQSLFKIYQINFSLRGLTSLDHLRKLLDQHLGFLEFEKLEIPMHVGVSNMTAGTFELISTGAIIPAVEASCAIPILFEPVKLNNQVYADGGLMNNLPVEILRPNADCVVGIDVNGIRPDNKLTNVVKIGERSLHMLLHQNAKERLNQCDLGISLEETSRYHYWDLNKSQELFDIGYLKTKLNIATLEKLLM